MIAALRSAGVEVTECHEPLWYGIEDRVKITKGGWLSPYFWYRVIKTYYKLLIKYKNIDDYDVLMVGYPGLFDVFIARILATCRRKPLVWDILMSLYLVAKERNLDDRPFNSVSLIKYFEKKALKLPDLLIQDTKTYVHWFSDFYGVPVEKFRLIPIGADESIFFPEYVHKDVRKFTVLSYGTFIPNHGLTTVLEAANLLKNYSDIQFLFIGDGPDKAGLIKKSKSFLLNNVSFIDWLEPESLVNKIRTADVCLGAFGHTAQSLMTVHNKIYESMATGKAIIAGDSPAIREQFDDFQELLICQRNPESLAEAILLLRENPFIVNKLEINSRNAFIKKYSFPILGAKLVEYLKEIC
jgi:glycosyltransferase involved in cell wall biosynthesis